MNGIILAIVGSSINFRHTNGQVVSEWPVSENAKISLNGKPAGLGDLREGDQVTVSGQPATDVLVYRDPVNQPAPPIRSSVPQDPRNRLVNTVDPALGAQTAHPESSSTGHPGIPEEHHGVPPKVPSPHAHTADKAADDGDVDDSDDDDDKAPKPRRGGHQSSRKNH